MIEQKEAKKLAHDIIRTMNKYANFRSYWRHTERKETILKNITHTLITHFESKSRELEWK